ncbi:copper chaperone PCu(A)C [Sulfitobacter sp. JBTF-M27]|uniref:Copper chaperone PCu(A)C n=1 Tax=Sulfitobacter sediminilitoris TaxID=2698830 RepID=A0A6P0C804_9RHOB|nr:copper chaperone PCu(A)C [Sulfitobacter sediminilitoris]NEK22321.1 copper chaperone PCu(A)C [Sulfitobacter sediminilitoris]
MKLTRLFAAGSTALMLMAAPLLAGDIMVKDAYARSSTPSSVTGAAFLILMNEADTDDRLIAAASDVANRVELHTHKQDANGVMQMMEVEEGFVVPANGMHELKRGGDHIMLMGLKRPLEQGEEITVTLTFEKAGEMEVQIPVDRERKPSHGSMSQSNDS